MSLTVTSLDTTRGFVTLRAVTPVAIKTNLVRNPSFEAGTDRWYAWSGGPVGTDQSTWLPSRNGTTHALMFADPGTGRMRLDSELIPLPEGTNRTIFVRAYFATHVGAHPAYLNVGQQGNSGYLNNSQPNGGTAWTAAVTPSAQLTWTELSRTVVLNDAARWLSLNFANYRTNADSTAGKESVMYFLDSVSAVIDGSAGLAYFDGSTPDGGWTGAPHDSPSYTPASGPQTANVTRIDMATGLSTPVRGALPLTLFAGEWVGVDAEPPTSGSFYYRIEWSNGTVEETPVQSLDLPGTWLRSVVRPALNRRVNIVEQPTLSLPASGSVMEVVGRSNPIATTMVRRSPRGSFVAYTDGPDEFADMLALLQSGTVLILSTPTGYTWGSRYIAIADVDVEPIVKMGNAWHHKWTLPFTVVDYPLGDSVIPGVTWSDVLGRYATWGAVLQGEADWGDVAEGV